MLAVVGLALLSLSATWNGLAQADDNPWSAPINLSASGAASQPTLVVASDGTLHALWWDAFDGEQYARTKSMTDTTWTTPRTVPQVVGDRQVDDKTGKVTLTAPKQVQMMADARGNVYALWRDKDDQLLGAQLQGSGWSAGTDLSDAATVVSMADDVSGTVHLAYVRPSSDGGLPAGIYYRTTKGQGWSAPILVAASPYFRSAKPDQMALSVASNGRGQTIVVWDDVRREQSVMAQSSDGGVTWSAPQPVKGVENGGVTQAQVAATADGDFLLLWHDPAAGGCGLTQRRSLDGGQTWSAPERILSGLNRCAGHSSFSRGGDGRLWLIISPDPGDSSGAGVVTLAAWDGRHWSESVGTSISFFDEAARRNVSLGCLSAAMSGQVVGLIGCDDRSDVWATRSQVELVTLIPALQPAWQSPEALSGQNNTISIPALAADEQGRFYALWSEAPSAADPGQALAAASWDGNRWSRAAQVLRSPAGAKDFGANVQAISKAEQPALAVDSQAHLHAVWSGGTAGTVYYSQAYIRDAAALQGWSEPKALPGPTDSGSWPDIVADPRGTVLYAAYAVPYNEDRGIYVVRSVDGGASWLTPTLAFDAARAGWGGIDKPRLAFDPATGVLHLAWLQANLPGSTDARAIYMAHSTDEGQTWSGPQKVTEGAVDWPRLAVAGKDQVYVAWLLARRATDLQEVWGAYSPDGGARWTDPQAMRGWLVNGPVGLTGDNAGHLYLVGIGAANSGAASSGVASNTESVLRFATWNGQAWDAVESMGLGQVATSGNAVVAAAAPQAAHLLALLREWTWQADGSGRFQTVASSRAIAPGATVQPMPTFTPMPTPTPQPTQTPQPTATLQPRPRVLEPPRALASGLTQNLAPLVLGGILSGLIAAALVVRALWKQRK